MTLLFSGKTCREPLTANQNITWSCPEDEVKIRGSRCKASCPLGQKLTSANSVTTCFSKNMSWYPDPRSFACIPGISENHMVTMALAGIVTVFLIASLVIFLFYRNSRKPSQQKGKTNLFKPSLEIREEQQCLRQKPRKERESSLSKERYK